MKKTEHYKLSAEGGEVVILMFYSKLAVLILLNITTIAIFTEAGIIFYFLVFNRNSEQSFQNSPFQTSETTPASS